MAGLASRQLLATGRPDPELARTGDALGRRPARASEHERTRVLAAQAVLDERNADSALRSRRGPASEAMLAKGQGAASERTAGFALPAKLEGLARLALVTACELDRPALARVAAPIARGSRAGSWHASAKVTPEPRLAARLRAAAALVGEVVAGERGAREAGLALRALDAVFISRAEGPASTAERERPASLRGALHARNAGRAVREAAAGPAGCRRVSEHFAVEPLPTVLVDGQHAEIGSLRAGSDVGRPRARTLGEPGPHAELRLATDTLFGGPILARERRLGTQCSRAASDLGKLAAARVSFGDAIPRSRFRLRLARAHHAEYEPEFKKVARASHHQNHRSSSGS